MDIKNQGRLEILDLRHIPKKSDYLKIERDKWDEEKRTIKIFKIPDPCNYMQSIEFKTDDAESKPRLLLIHGFGCTGAVFYKMIGYLSHYFRITTLDIFGMGGSGRPEFLPKTCHDCISFFMLSLRAWMLTTGYDQEEFAIAGHSLGGYLSSRYALLHPQNITNLILFSPVGVPMRPENFTLEEIIE